ncbi:hypothetical protein F5B18DRAFT_628041 [Nemania serpens]|nr:hypothetical protein F5B18DRAFT_628041 [Nemania serpens]
MIDDDVSYYPDALAKTRRSHRCLTAVLTLLGLLWLATSIVILVAFFSLEMTAMYLLRHAAEGMTMSFDGSIVVLVLYRYRFPL